MVQAARNLAAARVQITSVPRSAHEPPHVEDGESKLTFELAEPLLWIDCPGDFEFSQQGIDGQASGLGNLLEAVAPVDGPPLWARVLVFRQRAVARADGQLFRGIGARYCPGLDIIIRPGSCPFAGRSVPRTIPMRRKKSGALIDLGRRPPKAKPQQQNAAHKHGKPRKKLRPSSRRMPVQGFRDKGACPRPVQGYVQRKKKNRGGAEVEVDLSIGVPAESEKHMRLTTSGRKNKMDNSPRRRQPQQHE